MKTELTVDGIHCTSCKVLIEDICSEFKEIKKCDVDVKKRKVVLEHDSKLDLLKIKKGIESVGEYKVKVLNK